MPDQRQYDESDDAAPSRLTWFLQAVAWDGAIPFVAVVIVLIARIAFQRGWAVMFVVVTPVVVAIVRASMAYGRLVQEFGDPPPLGRQIAIAGAIIALLTFDLWVGMLTFNMGNGAPLEVWLVPVFLYIAYVACILMALRPARE